MLVWGLFHFKKILRIIQFVLFDKGIRKTYNKLELFLTLQSQWFQRIVANKTCKKV